MADLKPPREPLSDDGVKHWLGKAIEAMSLWPIHHELRDTLATIEHLQQRARAATHWTPGEYDPLVRECRSFLYTAPDSLAPSKEWCLAASIAVNEAATAIQHLQQRIEALGPFSDSEVSAALECFRLRERIQTLEAEPDEAMISAMVYVWHENIDPDSTPSNLFEEMLTAALAARMQREKE